MYTVKKVHKNEYKQLTARAGKVAVFIATPKGWAVVGADGAPRSFTDEYTGKLAYDVFSTKRAAQMQADWLNTR